ncbi:MAG: PAS domain S-box protein [Gemmatimonas sp.]|nr:PAS domain S-box protein [Gemmatimonas sp.]
MSVKTILRPLCMALIAMQAGDLTAQDEIQRVLVVYPERTDLRGFSMMDAGLVGTLQERATGKVEVYREEMDLSRLGTEEYLASLREHLREKYEGDSFDVAVGVTGESLDFLLGDGDPVFPGVPIVFSGIDDDELDDRRLPANVTGVLMRREFAPTLDIALRLHPETRHVVFVAGTSKFDRRLTERAKREFQSYAGELEFTYLTDLSLEELLAELAQLPPRTIVLYSTLFRDGIGQGFVPHDVVAQVSGASSRPVYGFLDQNIGRGIVGGHVYSLNTHGSRVGEYVLSVLSGESPSDLPLVDAGISETQFDWRQLDRWSIPERYLPSPAVIRFRDRSIWGQYRLQAVGTIALLLFQTGMIGALLVQHVRRRQTEAELRDSESRFRIMADTAPVMIWMSSADGRLTFFNRGWLDFVGRTLNENLDFGWANSIHPDDREACLRMYAESLTLRTPFHFECRMRRHDGTYRWVLCTGVPRKSVTHAHQGYIGSCVDVTVRKEADFAKLKHSEELAHYNRIAAMTELTASVAHELNQPLGAILMNATAGSLVLNRDTPDVDAVREILVDIRKDNQRATEIIRRMRTLLQKHELVRTPVEINPVIEEIVQLVSFEAEVRSINIRFSPAEDLPTIDGDRVHLQQVLMNLILNGFDALANRPENRREIVIRTERTSPDGILIAVSDSGPGIPSDMLSRLFEPFFSTKSNGLGMGLSITRTIVDAHHGRVWASNGDSGATFYVSLPVLIDTSLGRGLRLDLSPPARRRSIRDPRGVRSALNRATSA